MKKYTIYLIIPIFILSNLTATTNEILDQQILEKKEINSTEKTSFHIDPKKSLKTNLQEDFQLNSLKNQPMKNAQTAAILSAVLPGAGHLYLDDYQNARYIFGCYASGYSSIYIGYIYNNFEMIYFGSYAATLGSFYGIYSAYRDARTYNNNIGYKYSMPKDSFKELALASFQPSVLKQPEVWGGYLGAMALAMGITYFSTKADVLPQCNLQFSDTTPIVAFAIGISEEALFRGYLQPSLSEVLTPTGGVIASSLIFGAAHITNTIYMSSEDRNDYLKYSLPFITTFGGYLGWMAHRNQSLKQSVALHAWYDFTLFVMRKVVCSSSIKTDPKVQFSIDF